MKISRLIKCFLCTSLFFVVQISPAHAKDPTTVSSSETTTTTTTTEATTITIQNLIQTTSCTDNPDTPTCTATNITDYSVVMSCSVTFKNHCHMDSITVDCGCINEVSDNSTLQNNTNIDVTLTNLNASTFYNCSIFVNNTNGLDSEKTFVVFSTPTPSQPLNITANVRSTSFNISWSAPEKHTKPVTGYWVRITNMDKSDANHYVAAECKPSEDQWFTENWTNQTYFSYEEAFPDFQYNVTIFASTNGGNGTKDNVTFITSSAESSPPINVTSVSIEQEETRNVIMHQNITWKIPCNTNGPAKYFYLEWSAFYDNNFTAIDSGFANVTYAIKQLDYYYLIENLKASASYTVNLYLVGSDKRKGQSANVSFTSGVNYPNSPTVNITHIGPTNFTLNWNTPTNQPGAILGYHVTVVSVAPNYNYEDACSFPNGEIFNHAQNASVNRTYTFTDALSYYIYNVSVRAKTVRGIGNGTNVTVLTKSTEPGLARNIYSAVQTSNATADYKARAYVTFTPTCYPNGSKASYVLRYSAQRTNYTNVPDTNTTCKNNECIFALKPQYNYSFTITTHNGDYGSESEEHWFVSPSGVPQMSQNDTASIHTQVESTSHASLTFSKGSFDWSQGDIRYVAVIVSKKNLTGVVGEFDEWDGITWPEVTSKTATVAYQATDRFWDPWQYGADVITFTIGNDSSCLDEQQYCNRPLKSGTQYYVYLRAFTSQFYRTSWPISIHTDSESNLHFILGMLFGLLLTAIVLVIGFVLWKKGIIKIVAPRRSAPVQSSDLSLSKFVEYCNYLEQNPDVLKKQYADLCAASEIACSEMETIFAQKPENKRKNRYINILPYDHTRVKLHIDEDDEMCSDYINASYIEGYGGLTKYISTQGPLHSTCRDFWRMVMQEEVRIIVMVARFVEGYKDKCYKYFPKKGENMLLGDDMEVRCCTELDFGIYCIRSLQVRKDLKQVTITHMQFLQWPDFGVPSDTQNILQFYQHFKQRWAYEGGPAVIHCSAGVGRTGTLIATDILLQAIKAGSKVDVYNTVLDLRRQRVNMVQTEKQYMFIYSLVKNIIEDPMNSEEYNDEHFYENIDILAYRDYQDEDSTNHKQKEHTAETEF